MERRTPGGHLRRRAQNGAVQKQQAQSQKTPEGESCPTSFPSFKEMKEMEVNGWKFFGMYGYLVKTSWLSYLLFAAPRLNITQINESVVEKPPTQDLTTRKDPITKKPAPKRPSNTATSDTFDYDQCAVNFFLDKYGKGIEPKQNQQHRSVNTGLSLIGRADKDVSLQLISPRAWGLGWLWNSQDKKDAWYKLANNLGTLALYICN